MSIKKTERRGHKKNPIKEAPCTDYERFERFPYNPVKPRVPPDTLMHPADEFTKKYINGSNGSKK